MHFDLPYIRSFCPRRFDKFVYVPSHGASGGLVTIWNSSALDGVLVFLIFFCTRGKFYFQSVWTLLGTI